MTKAQTIEEISTWSYLAETLTQEHQQNIKYEILRKVENLKSQLKESQLKPQGEKPCKVCRYIRCICYRKSLPPS